MRILIIEDDLPTARFYRAALAQDGYTIDVAHRGAEGQRLALSEPYDGIVLDLGLVDQTGVAVLASLRQAGVDIPVLICTGRGGSDNVVLGLDAGADEYVVKPVAGAELCARVRALVRRRGRTRSETLLVGNVRFDRVSQHVLVDGEALDLTVRERALLDHFMRHAGELVTRSTLIAKVWERNSMPDSNVVDVHVGRLRRKLATARATLRIVTIRGAGFSARSMA